MGNPHARKPFDSVLVGARVRQLRIRQNLTQSDLASRSGVTAKTVYQIERGAATRATSIRKVCAGLGTLFEAIVQTEDSDDFSGASHILARTDAADWYAPIDRRRTVPADNAVRLREPAERRRLAGLGFAPMFIKVPRASMEGGPGTMFIELHRRLEEPINSRSFQNSKIYCQQGAIRAQIASEVVELHEGDIVAYQSAALRWIEPLHGLGRHDPAPLLLWIGAVRLGTGNKGDVPRTIVRKPKPFA